MVLFGIWLLIQALILVWFNYTIFEVSPRISQYIPLCNIDGNIYPCLNYNAGLANLRESWLQCDMYFSNIANGSISWETALRYPDNKVHGANMGPTGVLSAPVGPHVGLMNLAFWVNTTLMQLKCSQQWLNSLRLNEADMHY